MTCKPAPNCWASISEAASGIYGAEATIAHRRRHILWLIEHQPASESVGLSEATIDPAGHILADRQGYEQQRSYGLQ